MNEKDGLDALIDQETINSNPNDSTEGGGKNPDGTPKEPKAGDPPPSPPIQKVNDEPIPKQGTPKEILGIDAENWDVVRANLGEVENLRSELELARSQPKANFANENIAAFNKFAELKGVDDYNVFRRINSTELTDPLQVLVTKFILDNPKFSGQEDKVLKRLASEYKVDSVEYPNEDVEFNKIKLDQDADAARIVITGLRESLKTVSSAPPPIDLTIREASWNDALSKEMLSIDKISIPTLNTEKKDEQGNPTWEKFSEYEIPKELRQQYIIAASKANAKISDAKNPVEVKNVKEKFFSDFIIKNFAAITHSVITKTAADTRLAVEAEYKGATKLINNDPPPTAADEDPYTKMWK